jgi:tetratricopeptide (TPR) repeat protein
MRVATSVASGLGKQEDAAHYAQLALDEAGRSSGDTRYLRARALAYAQRWEEAAPLFRELLEETPESYARMGYLGWTMAGLGETAEAQALRDRLGSLELEFFQRGYIPYWQAAISTALGEHDRAISELQQAVRTGWTFNTWTVWYPWFRPLHDDPRYQALVAPK